METRIYAAPAVKGLTYAISAKPATCKYAPNRTECAEQ